MKTDDLFPYPPDDPETVRSLSARCRRAATRCAGASDQLSRDQGLAARSWRGPAAAACRAELGHAARLADRLPVPLHRAALALGRFADALVRARAAIDGVRAGYEREVAQQRSEIARLFADPAVPRQLRRLVADDLRWGQQQELGAYHRRYAAILAEHEEQARAVGRSLESLAWSVLPDWHQVLRLAGERRATARRGAAPARLTAQPPHRRGGHPGRGNRPRHGASVVVAADPRRAAATSHHVTFVDRQPRRPARTSPQQRQ